MKTTLGGCLAANIHGKNNFKMGPIGEHVIEFNAILPTGAEITCSPKKNADLFYAMIGGYGMLGIFTSVTMQMKCLYSGLLTVDACLFRIYKDNSPAAGRRSHTITLSVGWMDGAANQLAADKSTPQVTCRKARTQIRKRQ